MSQRTDFSSIQWDELLRNKGVQFAIGEILAHGLHGFEQDEAKAFSWYHKAATQGHTKAIFKVGNFYAYGKGGITKEDKVATLWYDKAAEQGDAYAQYFMGLYLLNGIYIEKDERTAFTWFQKSAMQGLECAQTYLTYIVQKAANEGNPRAQFKIGKNLLDGRGITKDVKAAHDWLQKSATQGFSDAQALLGTLLLHGTHCEKDEKAAFTWFTKAASQNHTLALNQLAHMYIHGKFVEKNGQAAFECYRQSALLEDPTGQVNLGGLFLTGHGVEQDLNSALTWFNKAPDHVDPDNQYCLGLVLLEQEKDREIGLSWMTRAAKKDLHHAMYVLGINYIKQDEEKAFYWFKRGAEKGCKRSQLWLDKKKGISPHRLQNETKEVSSPERFPEPKEQYGPTCGLNAFVTGVNHSGLLKQPIYSTVKEKETLGIHNDNNDDIALCALQKLFEDSPGPIFSIYTFSKLARIFQLKNCETKIIPKNFTKEEYTQFVCGLLDNYTIISPCNVDKEDQLKSTNYLGLHWVLMVNYFYENNNCYFSVMSRGAYHKWSSEELFANLAQLPKKNPLSELYIKNDTLVLAKENPRLKKDIRYRFFSFPEKTLTFFSSGLFCIPKPTSSLRFNQHNRGTMGSSS